MNIDLYQPIVHSKLRPIKRTSFASERELQRLVEANTETLFGIEFVATEFPVERYRIDSVCFDRRTRSFVLIEYKAGDSISVLNQGAAYMTALKKNRADFVLAYNKAKRGSENFEWLDTAGVNWDKSRVLFVSPGFQAHHYDAGMDAFSFPCELWEVTRFDNGVIGMNCRYISGVSRPTKPPEFGKNIPASDGSNLPAPDRDTQELYERLIEELSKWPGIAIKPRPNSDDVNVYKGKTRLASAYLKLRWVWLSTGEVRADFQMRDPRSLWNHRRGSRPYYTRYTGKLNNSDDFDYMLSCLRQRYDFLS